MSGDESNPGPTLGARASMAWDVLATHDGRETPGPAASVRARIAREHVRRGDARPLLRMLVPSVVALVVALAAMTVVGGDPFAVAEATGVGIAVGALVRLAWSWVTGGAVVRRLRRQVRHEQRVARSLAPLESAGWTVLHDRLVAAHRVPHVLVGPPGVVLVYDYLAGSMWRYRARPLGALVHSVIALMIAVPFVALHRRGLPRLTAATAAKKVTPGPDAPHTAAWARSDLAVRLGQRSDLDGWTVTVSSFYVLLHRPAAFRRWATESAPRTSGAGCSLTWRPRCPPVSPATRRRSSPSSWTTRVPRPEAVARCDRRTYGAPGK